MEPVEINRRHCQSCEKVVTDFTNMSDVQIGSHLRAHGGKVCGRFRKSQLDRRIAIGGPRRFSGLRAAAAASGLLFSLPIAAQSLPAEPTHQVEVKSHNGIDAEKKKQTPSLPKTEVTLTGQIFGSDDEEFGLIGASIALKGTTIGTVTDIDGKYAITVPTDTAATLIISYTGFATTTVLVSVEELQSVLLTSNTEYTIPPLLEMSSVLCEVAYTGGISYRSRPSLLENLMVHTVKPIYVGVSHAGQAKYGDWKDYWREKFAKAKVRRMERRNERALRRAARKRVSSVTSSSSSPPQALSASLTSVADEEINLRLVTSPNPFTNYLSISFELPNEQAYTVELTSATGQVIIRKAGKGIGGLQQIELRENISTLPGGTYFLRLQTEDGQLSVKTLVR